SDQRKTNRLRICNKAPFSYEGAALLLPRRSQRDREGAGRGMRKPRQMPSPLVSQLARFASPRPAIEDDTESLSFEQLFDASERLARALCGGAPSLEGQRVALLASPGAAWVAAFFGVLLAGGTAVPLSPAYPPAELAWFARDAGATTALVSDDQRDRAAALPCERTISTREALEGRSRADRVDAAIDADETALLLYTSGTTGKRKGAMLTHANLATHAELLRQAWGCGQKDRLVHALPLHHLHGLGISLLTTLLAGGSARMLARF